VLSLHGWSPQRVLQLAGAVFEGVQMGMLSTVNHLSVENTGDAFLIENVSRREDAGQQAEQVPSVSRTGTLN
jgi:hypothetical protein